MRAEQLAAVVLQLAIGLEGLLRREEIWTGKKAEAGEIQTDWKIRERQVRAENCVAQVVDKFQIFKTETVREVALGGEIRADYVCTSVVLILKRLKTNGAAGGHCSAVKITETVKHADVLKQVEIEARVVIGFAERSAGVSGIDVEWGSGYDRRGEVLVGVFGIQKEEDFVFEDRTAEVAAVLIALIGRGRAGKRGSEIAVTKQCETFAVKVIGSGAGGDVDGTGGGKLVRKIKSGLADLKFVNRAGGNIFRGGADCFVTDVHAVHFDARGASEAAADGDRGETHFGGIEIGAILNLHAGFQLRQVQKVSPVDREVFDLLLVQDALDARLLGIDCDGLLGNGDDGICLAHLETKIDA